jgi:hypothetical protein
MFSFMYAQFSHLPQYLVSRPYIKKHSQKTLVADGLVSRRDSIALVCDSNTANTDLGIATKRYFICLLRNLYAVFDLLIA